MTSQLSLNLGIFRTSVSLSYLQEEEAEKVEKVDYSVVLDTQNECRRECQLIKSHLHLWKRSVDEACVIEQCL